ncbi:uncharacterized protein RSE6_10859 [Rhynchosporium secalis]|uniref:Uncharacterized protein n=1 Tax=Rhynchosporium secalis TaxID=38038 RepID=A0A1E1MLK0_RHYSE|nr:uncharacterized protein RSE6_10859 [Rhynchosporium secalis]
MLSQAADPNSLHLIIGNNNTADSDTQNGLLTVLASVVFEGAGWCYITEALAWQLSATASAVPLSLASWTDCSKPPRTPPNLGTYLPIGTMAMRSLQGLPHRQLLYL